MLEETVARLSGHLAALRALVHDAAGRIPRATRLDVKHMLADRLHDDAASAVAVAARIAELGFEPARSDSDEDLVVALRAHLAEIDPFVDEPTLRVLTDLLARQDRHRLDAAAARSDEAPAGEPSGDLVARLIAQRLALADRAAEAIHADPSMSPERHLAFARCCWDAMRHVAALERISPWPGGAHGPEVDLWQLELPGHEPLVAHMRADDRRARAAGL